MIFTETPLRGAFVIEPERIEDERGFFARTWCKNEFEAHGLNTELVQCNISYNARRGTVRGMHYQIAPCEETKLVRCTRGSIYDVIVDLRRESPTYREWFGLTLDAENGLMLYIPAGFAHGFQTLANGTEVSYQMSEFFAPEYARGVRWDDSAIEIRWPLPVSCIAPKDLAFPEYPR